MNAPSIRTVQAPAMTLEDLGLSREIIAKSIETGHTERTRLDEYFPKNAAGLTFYFHVIAALRRFLITERQGWEVCSDHGMEYVVNKAMQVRIGYCMADSGTGDGAATPRSHRRRGVASLAAAAQNMNQLSLFPLWSEAGRFAQRPGVLSWFLLVRRYALGYRLELSLPTWMDDGYFAEWSQRILLDELPMSSEPNLPVVPATPPEASAAPKAKRRPVRRPKP